MTRRTSCRRIYFSCFFFLILSKFVWLWQFNECYYVSKEVLSFGSYTYTYTWVTYFYLLRYVTNPLAQFALTLHSVRRLWVKSQLESWYRYYLYLFMFVLFIYFDIDLYEATNIFKPKPLRDVWTQPSYKLHSSSLLSKLFAILADKSLSRRTGSNRFYCK